MARECWIHLITQQPPAIYMYIYIYGPAELSHGFKFSVTQVPLSLNEEDLFLAVANMPLY